MTNTGVRMKGFTDINDKCYGTFQLILNAASEGLVAS